MRAGHWTALIIAVFLVGSISVSLTKAYRQAVHLPEPLVDVPATPGKAQTVVLAGGCFWCTEAVFNHVKGVTSVVPGYAGGSAESAHYDLVSGGGTQHAEAIRITWDSKAVTYGQLLRIFFTAAHDPTQRNAQGPDHGYQYRSAVFYETAQQRQVAETYIKQLHEAKVFPNPIVTEVTALPAFYPAEEYHRSYVTKNPYDPYVLVNWPPKLKKLRENFPELAK